MTGGTSTRYPVGMVHLNRHIPLQMLDGAVERVDAALAAVEGEHDVRLLHAIESGSRAWGFPSPDSDFDARFIYVRRRDDYLSLWPHRDVIEHQLDHELDVNGWDLGKALKLLLKGNAVVIEWLMSPIVYQSVGPFRTGMLELARRHVDRVDIARHYLHLGERQRQADLSGEGPVKLKKIFYALRPAAALRWLRLHPADAVPPMDLQTLMAECEPPQDVARVVADLITKKAQTREAGMVPLAPDIAKFMDSEFVAARETWRSRGGTPSDAARHDADAFFREWTT